MAESEGAGIPVDAADERPPAPLAWRLGRVAVGSGLAVSLAVHVALVATVLVVSPLVGHPAPIYSVPVELVTPDEIPHDTTPNQAAQSTRPDPQTQPQTQSQPQPQTQAQPLTQPQPQAQGEAEPEAQSQPQPAAPMALPQPALPLDAFSLPLPPTARQAAAPAAPPPPGQDEMAKLIGLPVVGPSGGPSDTQANLPSASIAAFRSRVQSCWAPLAALANVPNIHVIIRLNLRPDGRLAAEPEPMGGTPSAEAIKVLLPNAISVLKKCQPYDVLPADKYDEWHALDLSFSPGGLMTASPPDKAAPG